MKNFLRLFLALVVSTTALHAYFDVTVTGSTTGGVWGTDIYRDNSDVATAAVHAGLIASGQTASIRVFYQTRELNGVAGSTRNGVTSGNSAICGGMLLMTTPTGGSNNPKVLLNVPATVFTGSQFWVSANAIDPDSDLNSLAVNWSGVGIVGSWSVAQDARLGEVQLTAPSTPGTFQLRGEVSDVAGHATVSQWYTIQVVSPSTNIAPVGSIVGPTKLVAGQSGTWTYEATDQNSNLSLWKIGVLPSTGTPANISGGDQTSSFNYTFATAGTYTLNLYVEDTNGANSTAQLNITVVSPPANYIDYRNGVTFSPDTFWWQNPVTNYNYLVDGSNSNDYGYGSQGNPNWLKADFGSAKQVLRLYVGGGHLFAWGGAAGATAGATLEYSNDNTNWTLAYTFTNGFAVDGTSINVNLTGRYWRLSRNTWFGTTEYRFEGVQTPYTLTVQNGEGSGTGIYANSPRPILASAPPGPNYLFSSWTVLSGPGVVSDASAASTNFIMGAGDAVIKANYVLNQAPTASISGPTTLQLTSANVQGRWNYSAADSNKNLKQWRVSLLPASGSWQNISGQSQSGLVDYTFTTPGNYTVRIEVTDTFDLTATQDAVVQIQGAPVITAQPTNQISPAGSSVNFSVTAAVLPNGTYQWQRKAAGTSTFADLSNGGNYSSATTATLTVSNLAIGMNGDEFRCVITNSLGSATSNSAVLTIGYPDTDSDGIPDFWEDAHGLNKNSATDALLDPDGDGLTNVAEYNLGFDPQVANTNFGAGVGNSATTAWPAADAAKTESVGSTNGALSVDSSGAATYTLPIYTPPGIAGVEPSLALRYSSNGPNGLLGVGWSLGGLSLITRGASSHELYPSADSLSDRADYDTLDRFFLDGNRLEAVSGIYGADASEYRTSQETFSKVKFHSSGGASWFEVWTKAGLRMEFGNSADSRTGTDALNQAVWLLNRVEDRSGNYLTVIYTTNDTSKDHYPYPKEISYTGRSGVNPFVVIRFTYKDRTDQLQLFQPAQGSIAVLHLVDKIDVIYKTQAAVETVVRRYTMDYETSAYTTRSRLRSVQETGLNGKQLPPTVFTWNTETGGFSNISVASLGSADDLIYVGEFNGDGKADYVRIRTRPARHAQVFLSNGDGFTASTEFDLNSDSTFSVTDERIHVGDINGDGLTDFVVTLFRRDSSTQDTVHRCVWLGSLNSGVPAFTQDGIDNHVSTHASSSTTLYQKEMLVDVGWRGRAAILFVPYDGNWNIIEWNDTGHAFSLVPNSYFQPTALLPGDDIRPIELNGDGVTSFVLGNYGAGTQASPRRTAVVKRNDQNYQLYEMSTAFNSVDYKIHVGDFNGDGLSDFLALQATSGGARKVFAGAFSLSPITSGSDLNFTESADWYDQKITVGDFNGDGRDDLFVQRASESQLWVATASTTAPANFALAATVSNGPLKNEQVVPLDMNGDGRLDLFIRGDQSAGNNSTACRVLRANTSAAPSDVITKVTNGLGATTDLAYASLTDTSVYTKGSAATGMTNLQLPINVVKSLTFDLAKGSVSTAADTFTDSNASYALTFKYEGLRAAPYRGILGFAAQEVTDSRTQLITRTERRQDYPYTGFVTRTKVYRKSGSTDIVLSDTSIVPGRLSLNGGATDYVYPASALAETWGINSTFDAQGTKISSISVTQVVDDYGNVTETDIDHGFEGRAITTTAQFWPADTTQWLVGRVKKVTVAATATGQTTDVRTTEVYFKDNDDLTNESVSPVLVTKTITEPLDAAKKLTTVYDYTDGAGHINKITTTGRKDATTDQSRIVEYVYDSLSRFVTDIKTTAPSSAGGLLTETYQPDHVHGAALSYTDVNNLTTSFVYDDFCRLQKVTGPDNVAIESKLAWTTDARGVFSVETTATFNDGSVKHATPPSFAIFDRLGRPVRNGALNADGHPVWVETRYNDKGYVNYASQPWRQLPANWDWTTAPDYTASGDPLRFWTTLSYDGLGRLSSRQSPNGSTVSASYGDSETIVTASMTYDSAAITQKTRTVRDPLGRIVNVYNNEALGAATERDTLTYVYNASGRLAQVTAASVQTSIGYDNRGLPTSLTDPNAGSRAYSFNAFGELYKVVDAKTQTTTFDYDVLGRAASRTASEGTTNWTYDTAPGKGKGLVYQVSGPDAGSGTVTETFEYDTSFSRVTKLTRQIAGTSFVVRPGYDAASRLQTIQYESPSITQQLKYAYSNLGSMREIRDMSAGLTGGLTVWGLGEVNAYGQPMSEILGNGIRTTSLYSATDGMLRTRIAKADASFLEYQTFDVDGFGNVRKRELRNADGTVARTESYVIDLLNRVTTVKLNGTTTLSTDFDSQGNIKSKSDVGAYLYDDPSRPHAVTQAGSTTFAYDANGNRTLRNGTQEAWWSSFDQPTKLKRGAIESTFRYDAQGSRVQQSSTTGETTYYVDGLHEYVTKSSGNEGRFAVASPTGRLVQLTVGAAHDIKYFAGDHLGSIEAITDYRGRSLESLSYDPWGRRRNSNWTAGNPTRTTTVNRGYTDHEMLDDQVLVNMNGRVYDPVIARFLGVDPIVGAGAQTYNGYSYVANNPLSAIDPSGFQTVDLYSGGAGFNFNGVNFSNPGYSGGWSSSVGGSFSGGANITFSSTFKNIGAGSAGGIAASAQPGLRYLSAANGGPLGYSITALGTGGFGPEAVLNRERANFWATARMSQAGLFDYQQSFNVLVPAAARGFWNSIRHLPDVFIGAVARQLVYANANPSQREIMDKVMYYQLGSSLLTPEQRAENLYGPILVPLLPKGLKLGRGMATSFKAGLAVEELAPAISKAQLAEMYPYRTPWRQGIRDAVFDNAMEANGKVFDPYTGREILRNHAWEFGHLPEFKLENWRPRAFEQKWTRGQWNDFLNSPEVYRPETPFTNGGHYIENRF